MERQDVEALLRDSGFLHPTEGKSASYDMPMLTCVAISDNPPVYGLQQLDVTDWKAGRWHFEAMWRVGDGAFGYSIAVLITIDRDEAARWLRWVLAAVAAAPHPDEGPF